MSYTYLLEQGAESSAECFSDIPASVLSRLNPTAGASCFSANETESCQGSPSGTTCEPSTENRGGGALMSSAEDSRASLFHQPPEEEKRRPIFHKRLSASLERSCPDLYLLKMSAERQSTFSRKELINWVTKSGRFSFPRLTWVLTTKGEGFGLLHTPTTKANYAADSMMKWQCCRLFVQVFGKPSPTNQEWLMGWPIGWTGLSPLATDKFRQWLHWHGESLEVTKC